MAEAGPRLVCNIMISLNTHKSALAFCACMAVDAKKRQGRKGTATSTRRGTVGKVVLTVKTKRTESVFYLVRQLALLSRIKYISLSIKTPGRIHDIAVFYHSPPPESGLQREKTILKALNPLVDYFDREDVEIKGIIQTEGNEDEINELIKAFNTRDTVTVVN